MADRDLSELDFGISGMYLFVYRTSSLALPLVENRPRGYSESTQVRIRAALDPRHTLHPKSCPKPISLLSNSRVPTPVCPAAFEYAGFRKRGGAPRRYCSMNV